MKIPLAPISLADAQADTDPLFAPARPVESPWANVPLRVRSTVRSYINSDNEQDREHAQLLCEQYQLDYAAMRLLIIDEMIAEQAQIAARKALANRGSEKLL